MVNAASANKPGQFYAGDDTEHFGEPALFLDGTRIYRFPDDFNAHMEDMRNLARRLNALGLTKPAEAVTE